jgi:DNA-binding NtrC family response regulator
MTATLENPTALRTVLVLSQDLDQAFSLCKEVEGRGLRAVSLQDPKEALKALKDPAVRLVLVDDSLLAEAESNLLLRFRDLRPDVFMVLLVARAGTQSVVAGMRNGVKDCLIKPVEPEQVQRTVENCLREQDLLFDTEKLRNQIEQQHALERIVGNSPELLRAIDMVRRVADYPVSVLITGESGTGKELIAEAIHQRSIRRGGPFVAVDCASFPAELVESELFGYQKGSFTGAAETKPGRFELAHGGTLLLDEIGNLPSNVQMKLLRVLQTRRISRIGSTHSQPIDVRLVSATNTNLREAITKGLFREDLYHRINEFSVHLPAVRERGEDLSLLALFFLHRFNAQFNLEVKGFAIETLDLIRRYPWPGNVRQLQNAIKHAVILCGGVVEPSHLPSEVREHVPQEPELASGPALSPRPALFSMPEGILPLWAASQGIIAEVEKRYIQEALMQMHWNKLKAAKILGIHFKTLYKKMKEYQIE